MTNHDQTRTNLRGKLDDLVQKSVQAGCRIGEIHAQLDPETGKAFITALQSPAQNTAILRAITSEGIVLSRSTLTIKRRCFRRPSDSECKCFPNNMESK